MLDNIVFAMYVSKVVDDVECALNCCVILGAIAVCVMGLIHLMNKFSDDEDLLSEPKAKLLHMYCKRFIVFTILCGALMVAIPNKSVMYTYMATNVASELSTNENITDDAREIYADVKLMIHKFATQEESTNE